MLYLYIPVPTYSGRREPVRLYYLKTILTKILRRSSLRWHSVNVKFVSAFAAPLICQTLGNALQGKMSFGFASVCSGRKLTADSPTRCAAVVLWREGALLRKGDSRGADTSQFRSGVRSQSSGLFFSKKLCAGSISKVCLTAIYTRLI